ncbi:NUDIX domain-containing protein [Tropicimonas marinistellae]|uniref:NUDIX domain-containing protein n=1 Tax=Tropicimonas marinistellae TaxID=1739787 RepID=UPI0008337FAC|nr:NUDIX domain-containing protein [Tropicimonas marinistellae]
MTRSLFLMRNGKAEPAAGSAGRPLRDAGKRQAQRIGTWLAGRGEMPKYAIAAPSARARVTAQKTMKAGGAGARGLVLDPALGRSDPDAVLAALARFDDASGDVLAVGHRRAVAATLKALLRERPDEARAPKTGTLFQLSMPEDWSDLVRGSAQLLTIVRPADLPAKFPWPGPGGSDWRDRPAYYYTQSAVIPYRWGAGELEVLTISSSKRNHWVVPKGICEPGLSPQASAAVEAREEAGVLGTVSERPVGQFTQEKWGATCTVTVFPMEVTEVLEGDDWEERHRDRRWMPPEAAAQQLRHPELARIVEAFGRDARAGAAAVTE